jgi:tRNA(fMet)-specific endonuclease VapC
MTRYVLDTNHVGALLRENAAPLWTRMNAMDRAEYGLCRPVIAELWYMVFNSTQVATNSTRLRALLRQFHVWEFDENAAVEFGRLRAELRRSGTPLPMMDVLIASIARSNRLTLVTNDRHFQSVRQLAISNWLA